MVLSYHEGVKFTGILYLREITESRFRGTAVKNLHMFRRLCGQDTLASVVLVTTKWDAVPAATAEMREADLRARF